MNDKENKHRFTLIIVIDTKRDGDKVIDSSCGQVVDGSVTGTMKIPPKPAS